MTEAEIADWDRYRLFFVVAETESISKAAARVGMSQPTLSRRMAELENHLGVPLLYRTSSGVTMTSEGKRLYRNASALVGSFEDFERDFRFEAGERGTLISISASDGVTRYWLLPRLNGYMAKHAALRFEVAATVEPLSVIDHDLDFIIRLGDLLDPELVGRKRRAWSSVCSHRGIIWRPTHEFAGAPT